MLLDVPIRGYLFPAWWLWWYWCPRWGLLCVLGVAVVIVAVIGIIVVLIYFWSAVIVVLIYFWVTVVVANLIIEVMVINVRTPHLVRSKLLVDTLPELSRPFSRPEHLRLVRLRHRLSHKWVRKLPRYVQLQSLGHNRWVHHTNTFYTARRIGVDVKMLLLWVCTLSQATVWEWWWMLMLLLL